MQTLSDFENKLEELPLLPSIIVRLMALDTTDEHYFEHVLELSQSDPTFALRVIRLSNSPISAPISPITNLRDAIARLGVKTVTDLVTSVAAMRVFVPNTQGEKNLWIHSVQVAVGAQHIAQANPSLGIDPEQAYLCGLLHDIGRFVLFDKATDALNQVEETHWKTPTQLIDIERKLYGFNHSELGRRICEKWGLPEIIIDLVANHHAFRQASHPLHETHINHLIRIVQMADFFSVFMMLNPDALCWKVEIFETALKDNCVSPSSSSPPLSVKQLQHQAHSIIQKSNKKLSGLGVQPEQ